MRIQVGILFFFVIGCQETIYVVDAPRPTCALQGRLEIKEAVDSIHRMVPPVKIELLNSPYWTYSDIDGWFRINNVEGGSYHVAASLEGYDTAFQTLLLMAPAGDGILMELKKSIHLNFSIAMDSLVWPGALAIVPTGANRDAFKWSTVLFLGRTRSVTTGPDDFAITSTQVSDTSFGFFIMPPVAVPSGVYMGKEYFKSGDSAYAVANTYRGTIGSGLSLRYTNLRNPSNVIGFVIP